MVTRREFFVQAAVAGIHATEGVPAPQGGPNNLSPESHHTMTTCNIPRTDIVVSRIAYGCADLGTWNSQPLSSSDIAKAERLIHCAYDRGITLFDHSDAYAFGKSEEAFGSVLKRSPGLRKKIVIQSKSGWVFPTPFDSSKYLFDCSYEHILDSVNSSLRRLGTDYLDVLLLHWSDSLVEPDEIARAFDELERSGKVRVFGVSNHTPGQIELLKRSVRQPLVINQIQLGLGYPNFVLEGFANTYFANQWAGLANQWTGITGTLDYCRVNDIQIQAYAPLRGGLLNPTATEAIEIKEAAQMLADLARKRETTPAALALAWLLHHPAGIIPIIGSTNPEHVIDNCSADRIRLNRADWYALLRSVARIKMQS